MLSLTPRGASGTGAGVRPEMHERRRGRRGGMRVVPGALRQRGYQRGGGYWCVLQKNVSFGVWALCFFVSLLRSLRVFVC